MPKKITNNQHHGTTGEHQFQYWASSIMSWYPTKADQDSGFDFLCQIPGEQIDHNTRSMEGRILCVSVRSTSKKKPSVRITRADAELFLSASQPAVLAIVRRAQFGDHGEVAIRVTDDKFVTELDNFLQSNSQQHSVRFNSALTNPREIEQSINALFDKCYALHIIRCRARLRLNNHLPNFSIEYIQTERETYAAIRSSAFAAPTPISQRPEIVEALRDLRMPFKFFLPVSLPEHFGAIDDRSHEIDSDPAPIASDNKSIDHSTRVDSDWSNYFANQYSAITKLLSVWNDKQALLLCRQVEADVASSEVATKAIPAHVLAVLARVQLRYMGAHSNRHRKDRVRSLLNRAEVAAAGDDRQMGEILALKASLTAIEINPAAGLNLLKYRTDPYATRTKMALLINQQKFTEAVAVVDGRDPHEWWCDVAVTAFSLTNNIAKAQDLLRWSAGLPDASLYRQCVVRFAEGMMASTLTGRTNAENILPTDLTPEERRRLAQIIESLTPVLHTISIADKPSSELELSAMHIAWQANHLLQRKGDAAKLLGLMNKWTPVPLDVARGVMGGYIDPSPDLPERLRKDHPSDLDAGALAAIIECNKLGNCNAAFLIAKELLPLANDTEHKVRLFKLFHTIWQHAEGPLVGECESVCATLAGHDPLLQSIFEASIALRRGESDHAIALLDAQKADSDIFWLQLRANALLQKGQPTQAVEYLLSAAKISGQSDLMQKAGDIAFQAKLYDVSLSCYEQASQHQPDNIAAHGNLAFIYTFIKHNAEKGAEHFRALRSLEPDNPTHTFNLAVCLAHLYRPAESLELYNEACSRDHPPLQAILGRAHLLRGLGQPSDALDSLDSFRGKHWTDPDFLLAYMHTAYAAGDDAAAHEAFRALNESRAKGNLNPDVMRVHGKDEALELIKQSLMQGEERDQHLHAEMLRGRMPWVWAEQTANNAIYWGWRIRTQPLKWMRDEPNNRARYSIYSTNGFHVGATDNNLRELQPIKSPPPGSPIVADISALITLHRLDLLKPASEHFGEIFVPAGYLNTALEDSRQLVPHQRSRQRVAEQISGLIKTKLITTMAEAGHPEDSVIVNEHDDSGEHRYRIRDMIDPLRKAGLVGDATYARLCEVATKPSTADEKHPVPVKFQPLVLDLATLETIASVGLLEAVSEYYRIRITPEDGLELQRRLDGLALQEETRLWHLDLWNKLRSNPRFKFVPHTLPDKLATEATEAKDYIAFLSCFIAREKGIPLLADDRVCQAFTLNEMKDLPAASFGSDAVVTALHDSGKLDTDKAAHVIGQLLEWRYRFIVPSARILKEMAAQYRQSPPGQSLQRVAIYIHDCMRDTGLFNGPEDTSLKDSMAMRLYFTWVSTIAEFLISVWADDSHAQEHASRLTEWICHELLPSSPVVVDGRMKERISSNTARLLLSHALITASNHYGEPRMADAMFAIKNSLCLSNDDYMRIVTGILHDYHRAKP